MTFLDAEDYISAAIDSVFAQSFRHWELLLVDDGSRDRSREIAERYAARDPARVRILQHPGGANHGIAASRNLAMRAARGRYIAFLDADDVYLTERLERHVRELEADPGLGVVVSGEWYWHSWQPADARAVTSPDHVIRPAAEPGRSIAPPMFIASTLVTRGAPMPATCSVTFRKAAFDALGGAPDSFRGHYEDQALFCKLLLSLPVLALDEPLARYRQRSASVTQANAPLDRTRGSAARAARLDFLVWLQRYLVARGQSLPDVDAWLAREISALRRDAGGGAPPRSASLRQAARRAAVALLPGRARHALSRWLRDIGARRVRRRVMQRIAAYESSHTDLDGAIRAYWKVRVNDTVLSDAAPGTPEFYAALDAYRLRKNDYLPRVVDFSAWADRDVLEIGCGPGLDLVRFARGGARVTGIDIAPAALELARGHCDVAGLPATLLEADGARLPFAAASFDLVYCHGVLSFVRDPAQVIAEAHRVLRPGGQAILMVYNRRSWMHWLLKVPGSPMGQGHADAPAFRTYSQPEFEGMLARFEERRLVFERFAPTSWGHGPLRCLRPFGWHLLAFCRKAE
jgi:glycosyltransferase involved in cell wall biosynthesis/SAM-dependent methyltransferase